MDYSPATAAAANAAAVPLSPSPSSSPSSPPHPPLSSLSSSPPPPWSLRSTSNSNTYNPPGTSGSPQPSRFSINRSSSSRSNGSRSSGGGAGAGFLNGGRTRHGTRHGAPAARRLSTYGGSGGRRGSGGTGRGGGAGGGRGAVRDAIAAASSTAVSLWRWAVTTGNHVLAFYIRLSALHRLAFLAAGAVGFTVGVLMLVYSHRVFAALGPMAKGWHDLTGGWLLVWLLIFVTGFPPVIGYSTACTLAGLVYGFPWGWPIAASANVAGSFAAFLASRGVLSRYVDRLVGSDHRFVALGQVLRHDGLWVLAAVRFCPLPYSLSNGFLATIPSITPAQFALSTAMASPKLLVHVFIGSRLALLAEDGDSMSAADKALNYASMAVFGLVGVGVGLFIYRRTMARAAEIVAAEGEEEEGRVARGPGVYADGDADGDGDGDVFDDNDNRPLMDPEDADVAALMDDDDISLWATDHFADGDGGFDEQQGDSHDALAASSTAQAKGRARSGSYHDESDGDDGQPKR